MKERMTVSERYALAIQSNHLEVLPRQQGAIDIICALAWVTDQDGNRPSIGGSLFRLMCEFDEIKGPLVLARNHLAATTEIVRRVSNRAKSLPSESSAQVEAMKLAKSLQDEADTQAKMAYAHVLLKLPTLASTKEAFGNWAMVQANRFNFMDAGLMPDPVDTLKFRGWRKANEDRQMVVRVLSGRVLDLLLEPTCSRCAGRGFSGGYNNTPQTLCSNRSGCGGSGKRRTDDIGNTAAQHAFSLYLLTQAERTLIEAEKQMNQRLRSDQSKVTQ